MVNPILKSYLDENQVKYNIITHTETHTSQRAAHAAHIKGRNFAKCVIVQADHEHIMIVLPACCRIDFKKLTKELGCKDCHLIREIEFKRNFNSVEPGAMSPFGNLHNLKVYISKNLVHDGDIAFNAGSHRELIEMDYWDYDLLVKPKIVNCAVHGGGTNHQ